MILNADAEHLPLADKCVDLVFTSPPYLKARWYGDKKAHARGCVRWVEWMLNIVRESCRVSRGLVLVNCAGSTEDHRYQPGPEMLLSEWWKQGGECWRPAYWHRVGIPGSGGKQWLRADVEYVLAFKDEAGPLSVAVDNTACGHPPKWAPGGEMANRLTDGRRVNQWGHSFDSGGTGGSVDDVTCQAPRPSHVQVGGNGGYRPDGSAKPRYFKRRGEGGRMPETREGDAVRKVDENNRLERGNEKGKSLTTPVLANPGNLIKAIVGGGNMGHELAHENEAPFPVALASFFVKSFCPKGGTVLDPFGGSGTTAQAAMENDRKFIVCDIRPSMVDLMQRRIADVAETIKRERAQGELFTDPSLIGGAP